MLKITKSGIEGTPPDRLDSIDAKPFIGKLALRITRWQRAVHAERYMYEGETHLDIGCGDGYFLLRSRFKIRYGYDMLMGEDDRIEDRIDFPDASIDLVTMLAVIEHLPDVRGMLEEIHRVLKPGGKFILTTPKKSAEWIINLYVNHIEDIHEIYFDRESLIAISAGLFDMTGYHTFELGLNQAFCLTRIENPGTGDGNPETES
jgi:SAM-dependent methyltransferase